MPEAPCSQCGFPILSSAGETVQCPQCGQVGRISDITIPTGMVTFLSGLAAGMILGPAILSVFKSGPEYLSKKVSSKLIP